MRDVNSHSLQKVRTDRHSVSLHCLFPLTFSGFFGFLGFFFPKKNPKRSARRSLAYALFPMPGRRARSPGNNVSLRGVGQRSMRPLLQKICTDRPSVALPRLFHLPFFGFFGSLGFFFTKKNPKRSARRSLAYILFPMPGCGAALYASSSAKNLHGHTFRRLASPFPFALFRFFRVLRVLFPKKEP